MKDALMPSFILAGIPDDEFITTAENKENTKMVS